MNTDTTALQFGDEVFHAEFGVGQVQLDQGATVLVRFAHGFEGCKRSSLKPRLNAEQALESLQFSSPLEVITKVQAFAIESLNDTWGIFSRSRVTLLPHQLWVCKKVFERWPARMLIADDVGLGKTIEAGLILWPLLSKETVRRVLILCPSSLTGQWQYRLRTMFDLRFQIYQTQLDTPRSEYWEINHQVIASLHTLRDDKDNRHQRLIESQKWDLVIVDEAHHVYHDQKTGKTKAFVLLEKLTQLQRVQSLVFFTGTPHRGRDFGFLSLLGLLREDLFPNPKESLEQCIPRIRQVMIRNNKTNVTDLRGEKLFLTPKVKVLPYQYSPEEQRFYDLLTEFIITGKAWAANLQDQQRQAVMLVLIAIQKLASSSVAAVRRALKRRLAGIEHRVTNLKKKMNARDTLQILLDLDPADTSVVEELNQIEEQIDLAAFELSLNSDEIPRLRELVAVADLVQSETKLEAIVHLTAQLNNEPILFFTEYKATQSQLLSLLAKRFGETNITFINGDERADDVQGSSWRITREQAADKFNSGQARFLVSTEAGGEGIDLQERCHILIHVDLPWNPMRLQQRVGRINRYGQKKQVEVYSFRNPDTVESRIWSTLEEKINRIQVAHAGGMDEPEDLYQLILGMTNPNFFQELFANGVLQSHERLSSWFDQKTATFGGTDVVKTVQGLLGSVDRFDFQTVGKSIPRLDLPDLKSFILNLSTRQNF
jgi:SNF2 family DNA or RNA helicase